MKLRKSNQMSSQISYRNLSHGATWETTTPAGIVKLLGMTWTEIEHILVGAMPVGLEEEQPEKKEEEDNYQIRYTCNDIPVHLSLLVHQHDPYQNTIITRGQRKRLARTIDLPRELLYKIIKFAVCSRCPDRDTDKVPLQKDMFGQVSRMRETCKAFYFVLFEHWSELQKSFFVSLQERVEESDEKLTLAGVLYHIDRPSLFADNFKLSDSCIILAQEQVKDILRFYATPFLGIMATNEVVLSGKDDTGVPTLSGFANYISNKTGDERFSSYIQLAMHHKEVGRAIDKFQFTWNWNMLECNCDPGLDSYLTWVNGKRIEAVQQNGPSNATFKLHNKITTSTAGKEENIFLHDKFKPQEYYKNAEECEYVPYIWQDESRNLALMLMLPVRRMKSHDNCIVCNYPRLLINELIKRSMQDDFLQDMFDIDNSSPFGLDDNNFGHSIDIFTTRRSMEKLDYILEDSLFDGPVAVFSHLSGLVHFKLTNHYKIEDTPLGKALSWSSLSCGSWRNTPLKDEWLLDTVYQAEAPGGYFISIDEKMKDASLCDGSYIDLRLSHTLLQESKDVEEDDIYYIKDERASIWPSMMNTLVTSASQIKVLAERYVNYQWSRHIFDFATDATKLKSETMSLKPARKRARSPK